MLQSQNSGSGHDALLATAILSWTDAKFAAENASVLRADPRFGKAAWDGGLANPAGGVQLAPSVYQASDPSNTIDGCPSNVYDCFTSGQGCGDVSSDCQTLSGCTDPNFTTDWGGCIPATWGSSCQTQNSLCEVTLPQA